MQKRDYYKFCISIKNYLLYIGCELIEKKKNRYIRMRHVDEEIFIPLFSRKMLLVYYVKDGLIKTKYKDYADDKPYRFKVIKFKKFHKKRNFNLLNDDSTQTYF